MKNLTLLYDSEQGLSNEDRLVFENYFIGALSTSVSTDEWMKSLDIARRLLTQNHQKV